MTQANPILTGQMKIVWQRLVQSPFGFFIKLDAAEEGAHFRALCTIVTLKGMETRCGTEHWPTLRDAKNAAAALACGAINEFYNAAQSVYQEVLLEPEDKDLVSEIVAPGSSLILPHGVH